MRPVPRGPAPGATQLPCPRGIFPGVSELVIRPVTPAIPPLPPALPAIAVLLAQPDGGWEILDPGSANGTLVNGAVIATGTRVAGRDGDRVSLGGWTVLMIVAG